MRLLDTIPLKYGILGWVIFLILLLLGKTLFFNIWNSIGDINPVSIVKTVPVAPTGIHIAVLPSSVDSSRFDQFYALLREKFGMPTLVVVVSSNDSGSGEYFLGISQHFPGVKTMPFVLRRELNPDMENEAIARTIANMTGNVLVLTPVDFSNGVDEPFAKLHDALSVEILRNGSPEAFKKTETECRNCLAVAKSIAIQTGQNDFSLIERTSVDTISNTRNFTGNVSQIYGFFTSENPAVPAEKSAFFAFFGDTHMGRGFERYEASSSGFITRTLASFYEKRDIGIPLDTGYRRILFGFDRVIANLETAVSTPAGCLPSQKSVRIIMPPRNIAILKSIGIDTVDLANNHAYDCGTAAYIRAKTNLADAGFQYFGDGRKTESEIFKTEIRGVKYAFVGLNGIDITNDWDKKIETVQALSFSGYVPIVSLHWGTEYSTWHTLAQQKLAYRFVDAGARLIIGHHPHVVEDSEIYRGIPIFYSLGNFIFDQPFPETLPGLGVACEISHSATKCTELPYDRNEKDFSVKFR